MTAVSPTTVPQQRVERVREPFVRRLVRLVVQIRSDAGEGLEATIARAVDEAFASIARDYRR